MARWLVTHNHYYWVVLGIITIFAAGLRFWNLGQFPELVFDEVFFAKYGFFYLTDQTFFDTHPPLAKYLIGFGIWSYNIMPFTETVELSQAQITDLSPVAWRWMNGLIGTLLVPLVAMLSFRMSKSRLLALIAAFFVAVEGMLIVESRYALNNLYLAFFGLLAIYFFAVANDAKKHTYIFLALCAVSLGLCFSVKWNGLGYSACVWAVLVLFYLIRLFNRSEVGALTENNLALGKLSQLNPLLVFSLLIFLLAICYYLVFIPHIRMNPEFDFVELQRQILGYHSDGVKPDEHPYCSSWYGWPMLLRPMGYYFKATEEAGTTFFTDVHLLGNPFLVWLGAMSIVVMSAVLSFNIYQAVFQKRVAENLMLKSLVVSGFFANFLPFAFVSRCIFLYLYIPSLIFSLVALAWLVRSLIVAEKLVVKCLGYILVLVVAISFLYWSPLFLGVSIERDFFYKLMWFRSWI